MSFAKYIPKKGKHVTDPAAVLSFKSKCLTISGKGAETLELENKAANLYFDADTRQIGVEFVAKDQGMTAISSIRGRDEKYKSRRISLTGFMNSFKLDGLENSAPVTVDVTDPSKALHDGMLLFRVPEKTA